MKERKLTQLTHEEIREKLRNMVVDFKKYLPCRYIGLVVKNPQYNPDDFSQEIEDSEEYISWDEQFDSFVKGEGRKNSEKWWENHIKNCQGKFLPFAVLAASGTYKLDDGSLIRNYNNEPTMNKILELEKEYGEIYDII